MSNAQDNINYDSIISKLQNNESLSFEMVSIFALSDFIQDLNRS